jgi:photosystem II stability/assembly factor-like uncharacterized protein
MSKGVFLFTILLLVKVSVSFSQVGTNWKWMHEKPQGCDLNWVKVWDDKTWYAVGSGGTFMKTNDAGSSWYFHHNAAKPSNLTPNDLTSAWFFNKDTGFVIGRNATLSLTTNGGTSFNDLNAVSGDATLNNIYFLNRNVGWITNNTGLLQTTDGGLTWNLNGTLPSAYYYDVWSRDGQLIIVSQGAGLVERSSDGGLTWNLVSTGSGAGLYKMCFWDSVTGIACGSSGAVRLTTDAGLTWKDINLSFGTQTFHYVNYYNGAVYLTGNDIFKSTDLGTTWQPFNIFPADQKWVSTYFAGDANAGVTLFVGAFGLINSNIDNTPYCYTNLTRPGNNSDVWGNNSGRIIAVGYPSLLTLMDQIIVSTDAGASWLIPTFNHSLKSQIISDLRVHQFVPPQQNDQVIIENNVNNPLWSSASLRSLKMVDDNIGYATGASSIIYKTTNGGLNWDSLSFPYQSAGYFYKVDFVNKDTGWVFSINGTATGSRIYKTTDGGISWNLQSYSGTSQNDNGVFTASMVNANYGWVATNAINVYKTSDGGNTWNMQNLPSHSQYTQLYCMQMLDTLKGFVAGTYSFLAYTSDGGATWDSLPGPVPGGYNAGWYSMYWKNLDTGIVSGYGFSYSTKNGGRTWAYDVTSNHINMGMYMTKGDTTNVFIAGYGGTIHEYPNFLVKGPDAILNENNNLPNGFGLSQNFPNPFNPNTLIKYSIPQDGLVKLYVYNLLGQKVAELVNQNMRTGNYEVNFNASKLSSGVYFYKLEMDKFTAIKKMMVLK